MQIWKEGGRVPRVSPESVQAHKGGRSSSVHRLLWPCASSCVHEEWMGGGTYPNQRMLAGRRSEGERASSAKPYTPIRNPSPFDGF